VCVRCLVYVSRESFVYSKMCECVVTKMARECVLCVGVDWVMCHVNNSYMGWLRLVGSSKL